MGDLSPEHKAVVDRMMEELSEKEGGLDGASKKIETDKELEPGSPLNASEYWSLDDSGVTMRTRLLAYLLSKIDSDDGVIVKGGGTSGGLMQKNGSDRETIGVQDAVISSPSVLKKMGIHPVSFDGAYSMKLPASATSVCVNEYLAEVLPSWELYYDITTDSSSTLGGNLVTGGLGDNRMGLEVIGVTLLLPNNETVYTEDPDIINALRGSQGFAGMVTEVNVRLREVPKNTEQVIVHLEGTDHETAYAESLPALVSTLYPYLRDRDPNGVWVDGIEIMDSTGVSTILRIDPDLASNSRIMRELQEAMEGCSVSAVMLRVRHSEETTMESAEGTPLADLRQKIESMQSPQYLLSQLMKEEVWSEMYDEMMVELYEAVDLDDPMCLADIYQKLWGKIKADTQNFPDELKSLQAVENGTLRKIRYVSDPDDIHIARKLRENFPGMRREEPKLKENASASNDRDIKFKLIEEDGVELTPEYIQKSVRGAVSAVMKIVSGIAKEAEELDLHVMWNGHLDFIPSVISQADFVQRDEAAGNYFNGGGNVHIALSGKHAGVDGTWGEANPEGVRKDSENIKRLLSKLSSQLSDLHGKTFGCIQIDTLEGEKHYPPLEHKPKWVAESRHFVKTQEDLAVDRMAIIYLQGKDTRFNFRAPDYQKLVTPEVWTKVENRIQVFRSTLGLAQAA